MSKAISIRERETVILFDLQDQLIKDGLYDQLNQQMVDAIAKNKNIGINLKELSYCNSRFISILLTTAKELHWRSKELYLVGPTEKVEGLLYVNGLDRIVEIIDDESKLPA